MEILHQERCARKAGWDLTKIIYQLKNSDKIAFYIPGEAKVMSTLITLKPLVLTANREVHTHEEAQVFVHENEFVTMQLLEETPAVLSLCKLCKDHGCSFEWVNGQEPRLTHNGKTSICKTDNFVPLVVPGFCQFRKQFITYNAPTGIVGTRCTPSL